MCKFFDHKVYTEMDRVLVILTTISIVTFIILVMWYLFLGGGKSFMPIPIKGCAKCKPGQNQGNPSGCKLAHNYRKCKDWKAMHPQGCCYYDTNGGFTCVEKGSSQCRTWDCDREYDDSGFACAPGIAPRYPTAMNGCEQCPAR